MGPRVHGIVCGFGFGLPARLQVALREVERHVVHLRGSKGMQAVPSGCGGRRLGSCGGQGGHRTGMAGPSVAWCWWFILVEVQFVSPPPSSGASSFSFMCTWQGAVG